MKANFKGALKNYKVDSYINVIKEAIVNSIQSDSNNIYVKIKTKKDDNDLTKTEVVEEIEIRDDGVGFTEKNRKSFSELYSDYKETYGCKGIGRLSYLKIFDNVKILSYIKDENKKVELNFNLNFVDEKDFELSDEDVNKSDTTITLTEIKNKEYYDFQKLFEEIKNHIYYYLIIKQNLNIYINNSKIDIDKDFLKNTFKVSDIKEEFAIYYRINENNENTKTNAFVVIDNRINDTFEKIFKFKIGNRKNYEMNFLLVSAFFNDKSDMLHQIDVDLEEKQLEFNFNYNELTKSQLNNKFKLIKVELIKQLTDIIGKSNINKYNKPIINGIKNKYLHYYDFINENDYCFFLNEDDIMKNIKNDYFNTEKKIINNKASEEELKRIIFCNLTAYISYRQRIIDNLKKKFEKADEKIKEEIIHNLFIPKGLNNNEINLSNNNLWLLDDKFMTFNKIYSEKQLQQIIDNPKNSLNMNDSRPDIIMFKNKEIDETKVVILEFKKPEANWYDYIKGTEQLGNYANYIARENKKCNDFYCYLFINSDILKENNYDNQIQNYINKNFYSIYSSSNEIIYCKKEDLLSGGRLAEKIGFATIFIIPYNSITEDANSRNKTFMDIIENNINLLEIIKNEK